MTATITKPTNNNLQTHYNHLAYMLLEKAQQQKTIRKYDLETIVLPYFTLLRSNPIPRNDFIKSLTKQKISII